MPQNDYIDRFRQQYGERYSTDDSSWLQKHLLTLRIGLTNQNVGVREPLVRVTMLRRRRKICADYEQSYTSRKGIRRRSR